MSSGAVPASRVVGRYAIFEPIASGGMATVHLGKLIGEAGFSRTVAIKRLHENFVKSAQFVAMMVDEARLASRIRHPNVVPTLDVVSLAGELFVVMEYVHGASLASLTEGDVDTDSGTGIVRSVPLGIAIAIMLDTLHGLHAAHEAKDERGRPLGIVHRDVSPQNILVGADGVARVLDFGVAKAAGRVQSTSTGQIKGKLPYMAPEQMLASDVDRRVDIYAAGVVLWEALSGRRLFDASTDAQIMYKVLNATVERPNAVLAARSSASPSPSTPSSLSSAPIPSALEDVVMRAIDRSPDVRFATAREFAAALEAAAPHIPRAAEVGAWVDEHAKPSLERRAQQITAIERSPSMPPSSSLSDEEQSAPVENANVPPRQPTAVVAAAIANTRAGVAPTMISEPHLAAPARDLSALQTQTHVQASQLPAIATPVVAPSPSQPDLGAVSTGGSGVSSSTRGWVVGLGLGFLALAMVGATVGILSVRARRLSDRGDENLGSITSTTTPTTSSAPSATTAVVVEPPTDPTQQPSAVVVVVPPPTLTTARPTTTTSATRTKPTATASSSAAPPVDPCNPPWTIDSAGVRVPKRQCFK